MKRSKTTTTTTSVPAVFVPFFWPISQFFGDFIAGAVSPLVIALYGKAGVGKSQIALACAERFAQHGWDTVYVVTERPRIHITARPPEAAVHPVYVSPRDILDFTAEKIRDANQRKRPLFWVIDSLACISEISGQIGARFHALLAMSSYLHEIRPHIPLIVLGIAQLRQRPNPMSPLVPLHRPSLSDSLKHHFHAVVYLQITPQGNFKLTLTDWSAMIIQYDGTNMYAVPFLENIGLAKEVSFSYGEIRQNMVPPQCYEVTVPVWRAESI